jgi:hypothetical protein
MLSSRPGVQLSRLSLLVALLAGVTVGGCSDCGLNKTVTDATTVATDVLQDGIDKITGNLSSWQTVLQEMTNKLVGDAQSTVRNEVSTLLQGSIAVANASIQCDVDFVGHRVVQSLRRFQATLMHKPPPDVLEPSACTGVPSGVDYTAWQQGRVLKVDVYGYDFDATGLSLVLVTGTTRTDVSSRLTKTSSYNLTINLGGPLLFNGRQQKLQVLWQGNAAKPVSEIPVLVAPPPLCATRKVTIPPIPPMTITPTKVGSGDGEFSGNGPEVWTGVNLMVTSGNTISAFISMRVRETKSDWTEGRATLTKSVFTIEPGWRIDHIITPTSAADHFTASGKNIIKRGPGPPVQVEEIQGDNDGSDIGRTNMTVKFTAIDVWEVQTGECLSPSGAHDLLKSGTLSDALRSHIESAMKVVQPQFLLRPTR